MRGSVSPGRCSARWRLQRQTLSSQVPCAAWTSKLPEPADPVPAGAHVLARPRRPPGDRPRGRLRGSRGRPALPRHQPRLPSALAASLPPQGPSVAPPGPGWGGFGTRTQPAAHSLSRRRTKTLSSASLRDPYLAIGVSRRTCPGSERPLLHLWRRRRKKSRITKFARLIKSLCQNTKKVVKTKLLGIKSQNNDHRT